MARRLRGLVTATAVLVVGACGAPSFEEVVPVLSRPQAEQDRLPTLEDGTSIEVVDADSTRYLGSTRTAEHWVGLDGNEICLVQFLSRAQVVGSSCATVEEFTQTGLRVSTGAPGVSATGLLVPEGFDLADAAQDEDWVSVGDNLAAPAGEVEPEASPGR
ncbi:hypothetical protein [Kineococcus sp. G2]|uniref:hypothetical protein n=1 Tax=Kineococcus sp. G2 TaxID=3127484 RepID=UPI00301D5994